ncbi:MAG: cell division protein FtsI (penicillin-binding protein 3) [Rhodothermales bacterium]|jgi:cell division protein FtsI (penicillin-binding protein 3)
MGRDIRIFRIAFIFIVLTLLSGLPLWKFYKLQGPRHEELKAKAQRMYTTTRTFTGQRGRIYDIHGEMLATNVATKDIYAEPRRMIFKDRTTTVDKREAVFNELTAVIGDLDKKELWRRFKAIDALEVLEPNLERQLRSVSLTYNALAEQGDLTHEQSKRKNALRRRLVLSEDEGGDKLAHAINARIRTLRRPIPIKRYVSLAQAHLVSSRKLTGVYADPSSHRFYPKGDLLSNVLGYTRDNKGVYALEAIWDDELQPHSQRERVERSRRGKILQTGSGIEPRELDGSSVFLTIDEPIQEFAEQELAKLSEKFNPEFAYAIMANPKTGAIMAMAQYPTFNANAPSRDERAYVNGALRRVYDPGSTMKSISIAAAIDYGVVTLEDEIYCEHGRWHEYRLGDGTHSYGMLSVADIVRLSSNIGTAKIAVMMGDQRIYQALHRFGFGRTTNLLGGGEVRGNLLHPSTWNKLTITRLAMGHSIDVTPIQMVQAYCGLANQGELMKLYIVDQIQSATGGVTKFEPELRNRAVRPYATTAVIQAMKSVTLDGTGKNARVEGYEVAGKTGTAEMLVNGSYKGHGQYYASFVGFVPADDPAFVLLVGADYPKKAHYGGTVAAPTWSRIAARTLRYLNVAPTLRPEEPQTTAISPP